MNNLPNIMYQPGLLGFLLASIGYIGFFILQLTVRTKTVQKYLLLLFTATSIAWALFNCFYAGPAYQTAFSFALESAQKASLLLFLLSAFKGQQLSLKHWLLQPKIKFVLGCIITYLLLGTLVIQQTNIRFITSLTLVVIMLALTETIYRQAGANKWNFKPLVIGIGVGLLLDFYLLAEATLLGNINQQTWQSRGFIHFFLLPFLVISTKRIKSWGINVYVSRDVVLQSSLLLAAGLYLCMLAVVGYYLSYVGGNWTTLLQVVFIVSGSAILGALLFSHDLRRKGRVFIEKHFFANTFDYRVKWVDLTRELQQIEFSRQNTYEVCVQAWCHAIGYSHGALFKLQMQGPQQIASFGQCDISPAGLTVIAASADILQHKHWIFDFSDLASTEVKLVQAATGLYGEPLGFSLLLPIYQHNQVWGVLVLAAEATEKLKLNWELRDYLSAVTEQISSYLFMAEASQQLSENAQFAAFSRMSAFVVHDLKNVKAQLDMLLKNAQKHRHNPEFIDDAFTTMAAMQSRLQHMLSQLMQKQLGQQSHKRIDIAQVLTDLIRTRCQQQKPHPQLNAASDCFLTLDADRFSNVMFHLIDNAQNATPDDGSILVSLSKNDKFARIEIADTGCGMSEEFIKNRLFKPFDTTKGNAGMGIGAFDALTFAEQHGGQLLVHSEVEKGTTFTLLLPLH